MPDWLTHLLIGLILIELIPLKKKGWKSLILLGTILPDILTKLLLVEKWVPLPEGFSILTTFHKPFILILFILLVAPLFRSTYRIIVFALSLGTASHILSDFMLHHLDPASGIMLLYPFSLERFSLGWIWPEESYLIFIPLLLVYLGIILFKSLLKKKMIRSKLSPNKLE
ncbi:MAG TPA: metal-dependent hydrolase [Candidatus Nanoarchaeia archaeon]|nr:metal-dependent hydrolase [Candidatus Nanoarchaeia archaeon]